MSLVFKDALFDAQWLRTAGHASYGGAEISECVAVARRIREPNTEDWFREWNGLAERVLAEAETSKTNGRLVSAKGAYLRASNYFRVAYALLLGTPVDPRLVETYRRHRAAFEAAVHLMTPTAERIVIPYGDGVLHGYLFRSAQKPSPRPTLIITGGYDSTAEEAYFFSGAAAVERGCTCIVFDGPGQGSALIEKGMVFRPDWEAVVGPVVDYALTRPEVDPKRIALLGISFGGYLAPRAASGESRLAACIADPGELSLLELFRKRLPDFIARELPDGNRLVLSLLDFMLCRRIRHATAGWGLRRGLWTHGVNRPLDYVRLTEHYSLQGRIDQIRCPTLICAAENDDIAATARDLFDKLTCEKTFLTFSASEGAGEHCEVACEPCLISAFSIGWMPYSDGD